MTELTVYYHVSPIILGEGSIIMPGNWGRVLKFHENATPVALREYILELVRLTRYPDKPSRLNCVFVLETLDEAKRYREAHALLNIIYQVAIDTSELPIHRGNYDFTAPFGPKFVDRLHQLAEQYWAELREQCIEVLIPAPVTILQRIG